MLACHIKVRTDSELAARQIDFIAQDAAQDFPIAREFVWEVQAEDKQFLIFDQGEPCGVVSDPWTLTYELIWRIHGRVFDNVPGYVRIHAGCGEYHGRRFLVVGDSGAGKSTLLIRLLYEGFRVDGDEMVMLRETKTIPFPRRFHIKETGLDLLPQIKPHLETAPFIERNSRSKIFSFSPVEVGFDWVIDQREADVLFFLNPHHGEKTIVKKCSKHSMVQQIMPRTFFSNSGDYLKIKEICRAVDRAACFSLYIGDLDSAVAAVRDTLEEL